MTNLNPQTYHGTRALKTGSAHGEAPQPQRTNFFRRPRRCSLDSGLTKKAALHHQQESYAASSMMDAFAGLQMPPTSCYNNDDEKTAGSADDHSNSSSTGPMAAAAAAAEQHQQQAPRTRTVPHRTRSCDVAPRRGLFGRSQSSNVMMTMAKTVTRESPARAQSSDTTMTNSTAPPPRRAPPRRTSSSLQDMAEQAMDRQALPNERNQPNASLLAMSQSLHSQGSSATSSDAAAPTLRNPHRRERAAIPASRNRLAQSSHEPRRRNLPERTKSAPFLEVASLHSPRQGRRWDAPVVAADVAPTRSSHYATTRSSSAAAESTTRPTKPTRSYSPPPPPPPRRSHPEPSPRDNHNNDNNDNGLATPLKIEISPGVLARLRGARETYQAVENDFYRPVTCTDCQAAVCCILDASYLLCPRCRSVSPVEDGNPNLAAGGVGLGFTLEDLRVWQDEILTARSSSTTTLGEGSSRRGRRSSMW